MYGGLKKSASRLALVAAAGVLSTNAFAADLGGDCCADLEERVAELEATTARKGTRKTSLEIYGQVNKEILYWNDSKTTGSAIGADNTESSTRFGFRGSAKVSPSVTAGYSILIDMTSGGSARSATVSQFSNVSSKPGAVAAADVTVFGSNGDHQMEMRDANVWIQSATLGKLTLGHLTTAGAQGTVDLGGTTLAGGVVGGVSLQGGGLVFRNGLAPAATAVVGTGNYTNYTLASVFDGGAEYGKRMDGIRWDSPTLAGFAIAASLGDSFNKDTQCISVSGGVCNNNGNGPALGVQLTYAGEFSGVRLAAAAGYENYNTVAATEGSWNNNAASTVRSASTATGLSLSALHVPTGLFAQGQYTQWTRGHDALNIAGGGTSSDTEKYWQVEAGIMKNWFGLGATTLFGLYAHAANGFAVQAGQNGALLPIGAGNVVPGQTVVGDTTTGKVWGLGFNQAIDAAAMDIYGSYKNFSVSSANCTAAGGCSSIGVFMTGARVKF